MEVYSEDLPKALLGVKKEDRTQVHHDGDKWIKGFKCACGT